MRQQARLIVANVGTSLFLKAQDNTCPICQQHLLSTDITIDHVWPLQLRNENYGNIFLCHYECNQLKSVRLPTEYELRVLEQINIRLGFDAERGRYACRQVLVSKYHKTSMWLNELRRQEAPLREIERIELKLMALDEQVGHLINGLINKMIFV